MTTSVSHLRTAMVRLRGLLVVVLAVVLVAGLMTAVVAGPAQADDGTILRTFRADVPDCSVSTGIAFEARVI